MRVWVLAVVLAVAPACGSADSRPRAVDATVIPSGDTFECPGADYRAAYAGTDGTPFITCVWRCANALGSARREVIAKSFYGAPTWTTYFIVGLGGDCPGE